MNDRQLMAMYRPAVGAAARSLAPGNERDDRLLLVWAVFVPLVCTAAYALSGRNEIGEIGRAASVLVLLFFAERFASRLETEPAGSLFWMTLALFLAWLAHPLVQLLMGRAEQAALEAREVLYLAIWCSSLWVVSLTVRTPRDLRRLVGWIDLLGLALAASVLATWVGHGTGWVLGEIHESDDALRIFGPVGDAVPYCLLLFVGVELVRRRWARFAVFLVATLLGQTRGVIAALLVGFVAAFFVVGGRGRRRGWVDVASVVGAIVALFLALELTDAGRQTRERFGDWQTLVYEEELGGRLRSVGFAVERFLDSPLLGVGPGGYAAAVERENLDWSHDLRTGSIVRGPEGIYAGSAENQVAHTAAETGLIGLVAFLAWAVTALRTARQATRIADAELRQFFVGVLLYAVIVFAGTQSVVYFLDKSAIVFLLCLVLGAAERGARLAALEAAYGRGRRG